jgi:hypothetical protein
MARRKVQAFRSHLNEPIVKLIETLTSESLLHEYWTKKRSLAQSSGWLLVELPNQIRRMSAREQENLHEPLKSLKLEAEEPVAEGP